ncbi:MAG: 4Fe-4S dicluster domain-containing protein [Calditrichaceae bacterium]
MKRIKQLIKPLGSVPVREEWQTEIMELADPVYVIIPLEYPGQIFYKPLVSIGDQVRRYQVIGRSKLGHCVHSSISGIVRDILPVWTARIFNVPTVLIQRNNVPALTPEEISEQFQQDYGTLSTVKRLKALGIISPWTTPGQFHHEEEDTFPEVHTIIVKGVNEEPTHFVCESLLKMEREKLIRGFQQLANFAPRGRIILSVPDHLTSFARDAFGKYADISGLSSEYKDRIERVVVPRLSGADIANTEPYRARGVAVISCENLLNLVDAVENEIPFVDKYLTISGTEIDRPFILKVPIGTTLRHVMKYLHLNAQNYSRILVGGPMKGIAMYTDLTPLTKTSHGMYLMKESEIPLEVNLTCINCGRCTRVCPSRLQVHLIGRYAEHNMFIDAMDFNPQLCHECGLCGYVCPAHRPLVQLIKMTKKYIGKQDEYVQQVECSSKSPLERWELDFHNADFMAAGDASGSNRESAQIRG